MYDMVNMHDWLNFSRTGKSTKHTIAKLVQKCADGGKSSRGPKIELNTHIKFVLLYINAI